MNAMDVFIDLTVSLIQMDAIELCGAETSVLWDLLLATL